MKVGIKFMGKLTVFFSILVLVAVLPLLPASAGQTMWLQSVTLSRCQGFRHRWDNRGNKPVKWLWKRSMLPAASTLGGTKLEMIYADSESKPERGVAEAERLINTEKVNVLTGCWNSAVTYPTTAVAERYGIPFIVPVSVADKITEQGFKTVFRIAAKDSWWTRASLPFSRTWKKNSKLR